MLRQIEFGGESIIIGGNGALVASKSEQGAWHVVRVVNGERVCTCKAATFRKGNCRHVRVVEQLERERTERKAERSHETAPLAGPAIDAPLFTEARKWVRPKARTFEEMFPESAA